MRYRYAAYGIIVGCDRLLPALRPADPARTPDLIVHLGGLPDLARRARASYHVSDFLDAQGVPQLCVDRVAPAGDYHFRYRDGTAFLIDAQGGEVWADWPAPLTLEDTATYLLGPVFAFVLRLRGVTCLHASAVEVEGFAVGLMGPAGSGKSTAAAALARRGFATLSDDILALEPHNGSYYAQPGYPRLRLWPDSVASLFGASDALPLLTPNWGKRYLPLDNGAFRFHAEPLPLGAIYALGNPDPSINTNTIRTASPAEALMALVRDSSQNRLLDKAMRAREFEQLAHLVTHTPVRQLRTGAAGRFPAELCEAILEDYRSNVAAAHV